MATKTTKTTKTTKRASAPEERKRDMWSDISGKMRVWGKEVEYGKNKSFMSYSTSVGKKNDDDEYDNIYFDVRFKKDEHPDIDEAFMINIKKGFITLYVGGDGIARPSVMVLDYKIASEDSDDDSDDSEDD